MSVVYDVEGIVIGERAKLETIAEQYLNDAESKENGYTLEAKINEEGNLEFKAQGVGRHWEIPEVENIINKYLDDDVECYKLWGTTDGCWNQYTNDTEGRFYKQWYVDDYTHDAPKVFFDDFDEAKAYAMQIIKNNPEYVQGLEESGMNENDYFDEVFLQYLEVNQEPVKIVKLIRPRGNVVNTDAMNEDMPNTEKGNYKGKFMNLIIPDCFIDKKIEIEYFGMSNLSYLDGDTAICCISDSTGYMDWCPEFSGYLVRFVEEENFVIENGKSIGMIFEDIDDANAKLARIEQLNTGLKEIQDDEIQEDAESPFVTENNDEKTTSAIIHDIIYNSNARVLVKRTSDYDSADRGFMNLAKSYGVGCDSIDFNGLTFSDFTRKLTSLQKNDFLLAFNLELADPLVLDYLKGAVNSFKISISLSQDPNSKTIDIDLNPFTLIICDEYTNL